MKKLLLLLSVVCTVVITSCDNDTSVNPQPLGKATVSGIVRANFNTTNDSPTKTFDAVANKKLNVSVNDDNGSIRYFEATTDAEGKYSIEIQLGNQELNVTVRVVDFRADVTTASGAQSTVFSGFSKSTYVENGGDYILDLTY
jgi:hypothetical protein